MNAKYLEIWLVRWLNKNAACAPASVSDTEGSAAILMAAFDLRKLSADLADAIVMREVEK